MNINFTKYYNSKYQILKNSLLTQLNFRQAAGAYPCKQSLRTQAGAFTQHACKTKFARC